MLLADIGNTHTHLYDGREVTHLTHNNAIERYAQKSINYISVNRSAEEKITNRTKWKNISSLITLDGAYDTMGVDRRALCLSHIDGVFVDAGSAITVDVMEGRVYQGGFILPGYRAMLESYGTISPVLKHELNYEVSTDSLPLTTKDGISYGIIASIKSIIEKHQKDKMIYFTGGDGEHLSSLIEESIFDDTLVFLGMQQALKKSKSDKDKGYYIC
ncbi:MAG: type III pantothenate kinase [Campylobacterota bacterium]|nr:type III pantothenate kinase [Campylobacterota bacterium]